MAYITISNSKRILKKIDLKEIGNIEGVVYKKPIYLLSSWEIKYLLLMKSLFQYPEEFASKVYKPVINKDTLQYVFESEQPPSYHLNKNCERLNSSFKNFVIPFEIKARVSKNALKEGKSTDETIILVEKQVRLFRDWFKTNIELFLNKPEEFLKKLESNWNVQSNVNEIEKSNSGPQIFENLDLNELEFLVDKIISEAGKYFVNNLDKQHLIRRFQKLTFLAYSKNRIEINDTELSDDELKSFLLNYDTKFKKPIKELLIQYYRVKYNPELSFEGHLLGRLNFRPCSVCRGTFDENSLIEESEFPEIKLSSLIAIDDSELSSFYPSVGSNNSQTKEFDDCIPEGFYDSTPEGYDDYPTEEYDDTPPEGLLIPLM